MLTKRIPLPPPPFLPFKMGEVKIAPTLHGSFFQEKNFIVHWLRSLVNGASDFRLRNLIDNPDR